MNKVLILSFLFLICSSVKGQTFQPFCEVNPFETNFKLYNEIGETYSYDLNLLFRGFNLTYDFSDTVSGNIPNNEIQTIQRAQILGKEPMTTDTILAHSQFLDSNGTAVYSLLVRNYDTKYDIKQGSGPVTHPPNFFETISFPPSNMTLDCFDLALLGEQNVIVDCLETKQGLQQPYFNFFYIFNSSDPYNFTAQEIDSYLADGPILNRKTRRYSGVFGKEYVVSGVTFDNLVSNQSLNSTYMWIYNYTTTPADPRYPQGYLTKGDLPINAETLGIATGTLQMVDFAILGSRVYLLDHKQGLFTFMWDGNKIGDLIKFDMAAQNIPQAWGLSVNLDGGYTQIVIAGDNHLFSFRLENIHSELELLGIYTLGVSKLTSRAIMQSNHEYITVKIGTILNVYRRFRNDPREVFYVFKDVQTYQMFYTNTIYVYTSTAATLYSFQDPAIEMKVDQNQGTVDRYIVATSTWQGKTMVCEAFAESIILDKGSKGIYFTNIQPPPDRDYYVQNGSATHIPLDITYIGPNLYYQKWLGEEEQAEQEEQKQTFLSRNKQINENLKEDFSMILDYPHIANLNMPNPQPENWFISRIVGIDDHTFYQVHQDKNFQLSFHLCKTNPTDVLTVNCDAPVTTNLDSAMITFDVGYWQGGQHCIALVTMNSREYVQIYYLNGVKNYTVTVNYNITSVALGNDQLFVVTDASSVEVYQWMEPEEKLLFSIDIPYVQTWPLIDPNWKPLQVVTSHAFNGTVFIRLPHSIVIVSIQFIPLWVNNIALKINLTSTPDVFVAYKSLVVHYADDEIIQYNLNFLASPTINSPLQTYNTYDRFKLLPVSASYAQGNIFVMANDTLTNSISLLIYRTGFPAVNSLYRVIDLGEKSLDQTKPATIAAGGRGRASYVYASLNGKQFIIRSPMIPVALFFPNDDFPKESYTFVVKFGVQISSIDNQTTPVNLKQKAIFVNHQTSIFTDKQQVSSSNVQNLKYESNKVWNFDVSKWFFGPVLRLQLQCDQCGHNNMFQIKNRVHPAHFTNIMNVADSFVDYAGHNVYVLTGTKVEIYNSNFDKIFSIQLNFVDPQDFSCRYLIPGHDYQPTHDYLNYTFAFCKQASTGNWWTAPVYIADVMPRAIPALVLEEIDNFKQAQYLDGRLLVLEDNKYIFSSLVVFEILQDIQFNATKASITQIYNSQTLGLGPVNITSFQIRQTDHDSVRKIFITNQTDYIYFICVNTTDYSVINWDPFWFKLKIANEDLYITQNTQIESIRVVFYEEKTENGTDYLHYRAIVVTSDTAIYEVQLLFETSKDETPKPLSSSQIIGVYQNYGDNQPLPRVQVCGNFISLAYFNKTRNQGSIVVYARNSSVQLRGPNDILPPMQQFIGGVTFDNVSPQGGQLPNLVFDLYENQTQVKLLIIDPQQNDQAFFCDLDPTNIQIFAIKSGDVKQQSMTIIPVSDYNQDSNNIQGTISPNGEPEPKPKKNSTTIIIVVCVIAGIAILGGVGFYFYKRKQKQDQLNSQLDGYSMQEPIKAEKA